MAKISRKFVTLFSLHAVLTCSVGAFAQTNHGRGSDRSSTNAFASDLPSVPSGLQAWTGSGNVLNSANTPASQEATQLRLIEPGAVEGIRSVENLIYQPGLRPAAPKFSGQGDSGHRDSLNGDSANHDSGQAIRGDVDLPSIPTATEYFQVQLAAYDEYRQGSTGDDLIQVVDSGYFSAEDSSSVSSAIVSYDSPANHVHVAPTVCVGPSGCSCGGCFQSTAKTRFGRFVQGVYAGICNPDPCYDPPWRMLRNSSFYTDAARPQSRTRFRWDYNDSFRNPDRAEYLWARSGTLGPSAERSIDFHELKIYTETGSRNFSVFVETPYRSMDLESGGHFAGFADLVTGTKSLLHESRLVDVTFQFKTHIPTASPNRGLSNGHVTLEPSLLIGLQLTEESFLQTQIAEWIPIAGDHDYAGALLRYSTSYNHLLLGNLNDTALYGTLEYSCIAFQDGAFSDPDILDGLGNPLAIPTSDDYVHQIGGGLRLNICNKINFGCGALFSGDDFPASAIRTELQIQH